MASISQIYYEENRGGLRTQGPLGTNGSGIEWLIQNGPNPNPPQMYPYKESKNPYDNEQ